MKIEQLCGRWAVISFEINGQITHTGKWVVYQFAPDGTYKKAHHFSGKYHTDSIDRHLVESEGTLLLFENSRLEMKVKALDADNLVLINTRGNYILNCRRRR